MSDSSELYYIVLRGSRRQPIFIDDEDRRHFTQVVAESAAACGVTVHAYCWLQAEARLAAQLADVPFGPFAQRIAGHHARRLEREVSLTGSHFEPQYRGVPVDGQTALLDLVRHIHLAPLKAGLTSELDDLADYPWSSHRVYMGVESASWLNTDTTLRHFALSAEDARPGYQEFMNLGASRVDLLPAHTEGGRNGAAGGARKPEMAAAHGSLVIEDD